MGPLPSSFIQQKYKRTLINKKQLQLSVLSKQMNFSLNVFVEMLIALTGFLLLSNGAERNLFYSATSHYFIHDHFQSATDLLLLAVSVSMMLILVVQSVWFKIFSIAAFLYYDFLCYDILQNFGCTQAMLIFAQNYFIVWLAIQGCLTARDQRVRDELKKSKIQTEQHYHDEGWYPLELPVEEDDMESSQHEVERIKQLVNLPTSKVIELEQQIEENIEKEETKIKNLREKQLQIHFKLIMKVLQFSNGQMGATPLQSSREAQQKAVENKENIRDVAEEQPGSSQTVIMADFAGR